MTHITTSTPHGVEREARRYENRLLLLLFLAFGFVFFDRQALSFLAPYMDADFGLSNGELGTLSGVLALTWALAGMVVSRLSDRLGGASRSSSPLWCSSRSSRRRRV